MVEQGCITVVMWAVGNTRSKVTAQGQISVPAEVRRKLGIGPGSLLEWVEEGSNIVVRRAGRFSSEDIHEAVFANGTPAAKTIGQMRDGIRQSIQKRHARD